MSLSNILRLFLFSSNFEPRYSYKRYSDKGKNGVPFVEIEIIEIVIFIGADLLAAVVGTP